MKKICLVYHAIGENNKFMSVDFNQFQLQINYLVRKKFEFCHIEELLNKNSGNNVSIIFDDALPSSEIAMQYLEKMNIKYSIGVIENNSVCINFKKLNYAELLFHTKNHKNLCELTGEELNYELKVENQNLNKKIIIYPMGLYNKRVLENVINKKFSIGLTVLPFHITKKSNRLELPRICVNGYLKLTKFKFFLTRLGNCYLHLAFLKRKILKQNYLDR